MKKSLFLALIAVIAMAGCDELTGTGDEKGDEKDGKTQTEAKDLITAHPWKHSISIYQYPQDWDDESTPDKDESVSETKTGYIYTFGKNGTLTIGSGEGSESVPYSVSETTLTIHATAENGEPFDMIYTITKLTETALEGIGTFQGSQQSSMLDPNGNVTHGPVEHFNYTETIKFVKP